MFDGVQTDKVGHFFSFFHDTNKPLVFASHAWGTIRAHTSPTEFFSFFFFTRKCQTCIKKVCTSCLAKEWKQVQFFVFFFRTVPKHRAEVHQCWDMALLPDERVTGHLMNVFDDVFCLPHNGWIRQLQSLYLLYKCVLVVKSENNISAVVKKYSFNISASENVFFYFSQESCDFKGRLS